jgi:hypothetical protein
MNAKLNAELGFVFKDDMVSCSQYLFLNCFEHMKKQHNTFIHKKGVNKKHNINA